MAQIEQSDNGKKKKGAQKKMPIHVDFTPMVDMNMLLITFFMLCTTMIKSQTLSIALPSNEKVEQEQKNKTKQSEAITLILDTERDEKGNVKTEAVGDKVYPKHIVYYYEGKPEIADENKDGIIDNPNLKVEYFRGNIAGETQGIRKILHERNEKVLEKVDVLKKQWKNKEITEEEFQAEAKKVRNDSTLTRPVVIIKAGPNASYESLISALDEMQINQISRYQIDNINGTDSALILSYKTLNNIPVK